MSLHRYVIRRTVRWFVLIWLLLTIIFLLFRVTPGDPTGFLVGGQFSEETRQQILESFGLHRPLHIQYYIFVKNILLAGDLGVSFHYRQPVSEIIIPRMINTLLIMLPAMSLIMLTAYSLGSRLGWRKGERIEQIGSYTLVAIRSLPHFVLGLFLLMIFSTWLDILPTGGMGPIETGRSSVQEMLLDPVFYKYLALPFLTAFLFFLADPFLLMRGNMINQKNQDYVDLLRLKGLPEGHVRNQAARNALLPLLTYATPAVAIAFGAQILIEIVFSWPGIGRELVESVHRNDYPVAQGAFFIIGFLVITTNLIVDLLYAYVDPRIRYD